MNSYNQNKNTVVVGIKGRAGSGKSSLGRNLEHKLVSKNELVNVKVDHLSFASPLYQLASIKDKIQGTHAKDRQLYEIHNLVEDILGGSPLFGAPSYKELIEIVYRIKSLSTVGEKPRDFLLKTGELLRSYDDDCFINYLKSTIVNRRSIFLTDLKNDSKDDDTSDTHTYIAIISDARYEREAEFIKEYPRSAIFELEADFEVRQLRARKNGDIIPYDKVDAHESTHYNWGINSDFIIDANQDEEKVFEEVTKHLAEMEII